MCYLNDRQALRLMKTKECAGHSIEYAMGWKACIEWIKTMQSAESDGYDSLIPMEQNMVDDLKSFVEREKAKENRMLADWIVQWILESIISGECKITGSATDHAAKKMYVEFSFYQEEEGNRG